MRIARSKVHFIGIGGIGMSGLAELLHNMGAQVSGSDLSENDQTRRLSEMGVTVYKGHDGKHTLDSDVVVYSSAVKFNNVEYQQAINFGIPLIPRAEALAEIMRLKRGVAIAGTHGKTTTTSLVASIFLQAELDPTIVVGGRLDVIQSTAKLGSGEWLIAEADESDGSFLKLSPEIALITNIDKDHLDFYKHEMALKKSFHDFANRVPFYGALIACGDDKNIKDIFNSFAKNKVLYGFEPTNDYWMEGENGAYKIYFNTTALGDIKMPMPGRHNALNVLAAIAVSLQAGITFEVCKLGVENFKGVDRRFQFKGIKKGVDYYDDYAHHPTEIKAVLSAFKERFPERALKVLFQPHRYSRTRDSWNEFLSAFNLADELFLMDIYPAGEEPLAGVTSDDLSSRLTASKIYRVEGLDDGKVLQQLHQIQLELVEGDIFVSLGAGSVSRIADRLFKEI